jgi:hypothetical protein
MRPHKRVLWLPNCRSLLIGQKRASRKRSSAAFELLTKSTRSCRIRGLSSHCIRLTPSAKPDRGCALQRKSGERPPSLQSSDFSAVRFAEELSLKMGIFRVFRGKGRRNFSAVKTCWRSGKDSNPRYRSERCKSRRLRKLRGINQFQNSPGTACSPFDRLNGAVSPTFLRRNAGDCAAESGLRRPKRPDSYLTACLPRSPKLKISLQGVLAKT